MRRPIRLAVYLLVVFPLLASAAPPPADLPAVEMLWGVRIPMRDGVHLNATVFKPREMPAPLPVVFTLTPYIADTYQDRALYFAQHGYVFALVDARGRGNSEGRFTPFAQEAHDGHDVVEWLARQPWANGKVAMWGGSYAGYDQWATAKEFPPHLATIVPAAAAHPGVDFPFFKNVYSSYVMQWLTFTSGVTPNVKLFGLSPFWLERFRALYRDHRPYRELAEAVGNASTVFDDWLSHPTPGPHWDAMAPTPEQYAHLDLPILTITGHYDGDQPGALHYYRQHMRHGTKAARDRHYLIMGPWDHAGTRTPNKSFGGLTFGDASMLDLNDLHRQWYDWTMKEGKRPEFLKTRVAYYVAGAGAEEWKRADDLEEIAKERRTLYLDSPGGRAGDAFQSGSLGPEKPAAGSPPDRYVYDPLDTRPAEMEKEEVEAYLVDERYALNLNGNGLVYHSAPFAEATEISGQPKLELWLALDVPDTDFAVSLYEIEPSGRSVLLAEDLLRARYRESLREEKLVTPGAIERYTFDTFFWFSRRIGQGSRLRLVVRSPNTIHLQKNYNAGGVVAEESGKDARTAHVTLYHDAEHPSLLELPIGR
jgi:uncharacterized protein